MDFDLYFNKVTQKYDNSYYPYHKTITNDEDFKAVVIYDCVGAKYKNNHRSNDDFIEANCLMLEIDNDHTEDKTLQVDNDKLAVIFPDVDFRTNTSKSDGIEKDGFGPRPRLHVFFSIPTITSIDELNQLKERI